MITNVLTLLDASAISAVSLSLWALYSVTEAITPLQASSSSGKSAVDSSSVTCTAWLPLAPAFGTNTLHVENLRGDGRAVPLEGDFGVRPTNLHRPYIDELVRPNPDDPTGTSMMRRVPEVLDCWFESGSMPYAQQHYPFENKEYFENSFPADFIAEGIDQTRGWFYTLMVLSTALFDKPAFKNLICNGLVLAEDGQKMSKSYGNTIPIFASGKKLKLRRSP